MGTEFSGFYRRSVDERLEALARSGKVAAEDVATLRQKGERLRTQDADHMVENVVGVFGLPLALALNLHVDGRSRLVPVVVEEPSIVAALSGAGKLAAAHGGFVTQLTERLLVGQIQLLRPKDAPAAVARLLASKTALLEQANACVPNLLRRGGGVRDLEARVVAMAEPFGACVVVHLAVDSRDAMGANLVNTLCERLAPALAELAEAEVGLRILSNLTPRCLVRAEVRLPVHALAFAGVEGARVAYGIAQASAFADACAHRAVTHNKGIMNGIDAVALATGNDWRAIEANAHAWAGLGAGYRPLSQWRLDGRGALVGSLELPLKVGTAGGNFAVNPGVVWSGRVLGLEEGADGLARVMAAVGLAQNFAALRALSTEGIQQGHMSLHARSVAASAKVPKLYFQAVVDGMLAAGEVKLWKAQALLAACEAAAKAAATAQGEGPAPEASAPMLSPLGKQKLGRGEASGKVLLLGEHAVVYGARALAVPLPLATTVEAQPHAAAGVRVEVPAWNIDTQLRWDAAAPGLHRPLALILRKLELTGARLHLRVLARIPRAMGLGSSAALAVATVRALSDSYGLHLDDAQVSALAYAAETVAHGTASGVDNTLSTLNTPLLFRKGPPLSITPLSFPRSLHLVIGQTAEPSLTATTVARVAEAHSERQAMMRALFDAIDRVVGVGLEALQAGDLRALGFAMNHNHGLLNALQVSTPSLERAIAVARKAGALGAKLTGGGGGGSMVALCENAQARAHVAEALRADGFVALGTVLAGTAA